MIATSYFEQIEAAAKPEDLFEDADKARSTYRRLSRIVHPDINPTDSARAEAAFARLTELWNQFNGAPAAGDPRPAGDVFVTKRHSFFDLELIDRGDVSNIYRASYLNGTAETLQSVMKIPRNPANSDLVENEIRALKVINDQVPKPYQMFHPTTIDSFAHRDPATGKTRRCVVINYLDGFVSLRDVLEAYPDGIDPKHVAWIARRLWVAIDTANNEGVVHGAVFPEHVMIHPEKHGVVLVDWSYSREKGEKLTSASKVYLDAGWYGRHFDKPLDHRLDVHQAAYTLEALLGAQGARPFRAFFNGCRVASAPTAGELFTEFDSLLTRVYGKRKFVPFSMPDNWKKEVSNGLR